MNMSDALILGSKEVNKDVIKYAEKSKKPVLPYQNSDSYIDAYSLFYDQVLNNSKG